MTISSIILNALLAAVLSLVFTEILMIDLKIKRLLNLPEHIGLKPLDCPMCLSWWTGFAIGFLDVGIMPALYTAAIALLLERIIYKFEIL